MNRLVTSVLLLLVALGVLGFGVWKWKRALSTAAYGEGGDRAVATRRIADYILSHYPHERVMVIGNPFAQQSGIPRAVVEMEKAALRGLKEGLGTLVPFDVVYPRLREDALSAAIEPGTRTPLSFMMADEAFDELAAAHPEHKVWVSLVGLPANLDRVAFWPKPGPPHLALLLPDLRLIGGGDQVKAAFRSERIVAAVLERPGFEELDAPPPEDYGERFDQRFLLLTDNNAKDLLRQGP